MVKTISREWIATLLPICQTSNYRREWDFYHDIYQTLVVSLLLLYCIIKDAISAQSNSSQVVKSLLKKVKPWQYNENPQTRSGQCFHVEH